MTRIVTFDIIYTGVPEQFESKLEAAIASRNATTEPLSLQSHRREFEAWELGTWSPALERDFREQTETSADGTVRYRQQPHGWQQAYIEDVNAGRYYETADSNSFRRSCNANCNRWLKRSHERGPSRSRGIRRTALTFELCGSIRPPTTCLSTVRAKSRRGC